MQAGERLSTTAFETATAAMCCGLHGQSPSTSCCRDQHSSVLPLLHFGTLAHVKYKYQGVVSLLLGRSWGIIPILWQAAAVSISPAIGTD
jgi:hypothetical protein